MSPWRLEALRLWRTRRLIALISCFVVLGLGTPVLTYELPAIVKSSSSGGVQVVLPPQTAADGLTGFAKNVGQLGTLAVVVVAAASLVIDARPALAAFYRSRTRRAWVLVLPRFVAVCGASVLSLGLGTLCVWYETSLLFGPLPAGALATGFALESVWVCFCAAVVAFWASVAHGTLAVVGASLGTLLAIGLLSSIPALSTWLPSALAAGAGALVGPHHAGIPWHAVAISALCMAALLVISVRRLVLRAV